MRKFIICAMIGLLSSCSSNERQQDGTTPISEDFKNLDTTVPFSGCWLSEDYYTSIREFYSPREAQDGSQFIFIPNRTLQQTIMVYSFHEGGAFLKVLKNGDDYEIWEVQEHGLGERFSSVEVISPTKIRLDNKTFVKISPQSNHGTYQILEEILFSGQYTDTNGKAIEFKNNNQVVGLEGLKYYRPEIDYFDVASQVDQVGLGSTQNDLDWFGFKFNKDTLELFELSCLTFDSTMNSCVEVDFGQLIYKLWRRE